MMNRRQGVQGGSGFEAEAREVIADLQQALASLVDGMVAGSERRLSDVAGAMGIDLKLAWKLTRIMELNDPFAAGLYVPGANGMRIVTDSARSRGFEDAAEGVDEAFARFEVLRRTHAVDRRTLDMMLSGLAEEEQDRREQQARKAAFQANTSLWGVSASTRLMSFIVRASESIPDHVEVAHVSGMFGVSRTRPNVPWRVAQLRAEDEIGDLKSSWARRALDPDSRDGGPPVLWSHTSPNMPELIPVERGDGRIEYRLGEGPMGRGATFDLVLAEFMPDGGSRYKVVGDEQLSVAIRNRTPAERVVLELTVEHDLFGEIDPMPVLVSELWGERPPTELDDPERLPLHERVVRIGRGLSAFRHRHVPRHQELMARVFDMVGWDASRFDTYRVEMQYPPAPTALRMVHMLPEKPGV